MKTYLVTYYFTNGEVHAVRYEQQEEFIGKLEQMLKVERCFLSNGYEVINLNNVCRFTIDEVENE